MGWREPVRPVQSTPDRYMCGERNPDAHTGMRTPGVYVPCPCPIVAPMMLIDSVLDG